MHKCMLTSTSPSRWYAFAVSFCTAKSISSLNLCALKLMGSVSYTSLDFWPLFIKVYLVFQSAITTAVFYKMQSHVAAQPLRKAAEKRGRAPKEEKADRKMMLTVSRQVAHSMMFRITEELLCRKLAVSHTASPWRPQVSVINIRLETVCLNI